jgi:hypothetical protein
LSIESPERSREIAAAAITNALRDRLNRQVARREEMRGMTQAHLMQEVDWRLSEHLNEVLGK